MSATSISLSLVSHTNVGKTTLARTLLARDVGEVRDEAHVTETAEAQPLIESPEGDRLLLWDTPGFGDSLRLARRLALAGNPIGWFLTEVWDRWRDRPFWSSQRALRHVWEQCDVVLYLVDASQAPEDIGYLDAELQVLGLAGKPTIVLLNQLGEPGAQDDDALAARWQQRLHGVPGVHAVLPLDAFTRCWVQEATLWQAVAPLVPDGKREGFEGLQAAWRERQLSTWREAMAELSRRLARAAQDRQLVESDGLLRGSARTLGQSLARVLGLREEDPEGPPQRAMAHLAARLDEDVKRSTEVLIRLHGLDGRAGGEVLDKLARHYAARQPVDERQAAIWGGLVTGALTGLKADIASGGLTLGGGLLAGGVLGALAAAGAARGVNLVRGLSQPELRWDDKVLEALLANALLGYLAVAHHGRGRGAWVAHEPPAAWSAAVAAAIEDQHSAWIAALQRLRSGEADALCTVVEQAGASVLTRLYPATAQLRLLGS